MSSERSARGPCRDPSDVADTDDCGTEGHPVTYGRILVALLASPPTTDGTRTTSRLARALPIVGCDRLQIANLYSEPARDLPALNHQAAAPDGWIAARPDLAAALQGADELLVGWGLLRLSGRARDHRVSQIRWLIREAHRAGHSHCWAVGSRPRHPSRWHQYVSDRHGRTSTGTFEQRLAEVLVRTPLNLIQSS